MIKAANIETNLQGILAGNTANANGVNTSNVGNPDAAFLEMLKTAEMSGQDIKKIISNLYTCKIYFSKFVIYLVR